MAVSGTQAAYCAQEAASADGRSDWGKTGMLTDHQNTSLAAAVVVVVDRAEPGAGWAWLVAGKAELGAVLEPDAVLRLAADADWQQAGGGYCCSVIGAGWGGLDADWMDVAGGEELDADWVESGAG